jgi:hypothetical protein
LTLIFLCGVVGGAMVMRLAVHGIVDKAETGLPGGEKAIALERMTKELDPVPTSSGTRDGPDDSPVRANTQAQMDEVRQRKQRILRPERPAEAEVRKDAGRCTGAADRAGPVTVSVDSSDFLFCH